MYYVKIAIIGIALFAADTILAVDGESVTRPVARPDTLCQAPCVVIRPMARS